MSTALQHTEPTPYERRVEAVTRRGWAGSVLLPVLMAAVLLFLNGILTALAEVVLPPAEGDPSPASAAGLVGMVLSVVLGVWLLCAVSRIRPMDLGFVREGAVRGGLVGAGVAVFVMTLVFAVNALLVSIDVSARLGAADVGPILLALVFFLFQGTFEELVFRLYLMPHLSVRLGVPAAIVVTSLAFAALHGANSNISAMGLVNLVLFGLVFAVAYLRTGNAWLVGIGHGIWNFTLGNAYGSHVSGLVFTHSVLGSTPTGDMGVVSGGEYGMEGSLVATVLGVALIVALWRAPARRPRP